MVSPTTPTHNGGAASDAAGSKRTLASSSKLHVPREHNAVLIEDNKRLATDTDSDSDTDLDTDKDHRGGHIQARMAPALASTSLERFSKDVQAHAMSMAFHAGTTSAKDNGIRKRKHSDDPVTAVASATSTPGPSQSVSASSTPPSSMHSTSTSPSTAKPSAEDDAERTPDPERTDRRSQSRDVEQSSTPKRHRVYEVGDGDDESGPEVIEYDIEEPIVIGDDDEIDVEDDDRHNNGHYPHAADTSTYNDYTSNHADDQDSVAEVYGGSPEPLNDISNALDDVPARRESSPAQTILSQDSDVTITPGMIPRTADRLHTADSQAAQETLFRSTHSRVSVEPRTPVPQSREPISSRHNDPGIPEVFEVIDLTRPERRGAYPQRDSMPRVPGLSPQHSFHLPTLQRLVSRSSESVERSQRSTRASSVVNLSHNSIDVHEIPDDDEDRFGNDTVRIDNEVREVQLDPRHPWARGPIQLIHPPERRSVETILEEQRQPRQREEVIDVDDHLVQIDYGEIESDNDEDGEPASQGNSEAEDDGVTEQQVREEANWILNLRRSRDVRVQRQRSPSFHARSPPFQARSSPFPARSPSFAARPSPFPTSPRRGSTPRASSYSQHRFSPVARRPSPVPLILRNGALPSSSSSSSRSSGPSFPDVPHLLTNGHTNLTQELAQLSQESTPRVVNLETKSEPVPQSWVSQNLKCSICMDMMTVPTMVRCGHVFCRGCILMALNSAKHCPMCRHPTAKNKLQELEFYIGGLRPTGGDTANGRNNTIK
ncbi:hypothetical protein BGZ51_005475 [Haplosporangium sp. Z 767]|nr:hypothetical protein BGZ51_005475 [Haplosporangium sp. Z 767]KAF9196398.1 hypothetical protein BGZ50_000399 [Haplosporangium sp. Z 11]